MKKILCIVGAMNAGGAETFLMKLYGEFNLCEYQFDFLVSAKEKCFYDDEILKKGGKIFYAPRKTENPSKYISETYNCIKKNNYKYILKMGFNSISFFDLLIARSAGAKVLIARSTNAGGNKTFYSKVLHKIFQWIPKYVANVKLAPSILAANYVFGEKCDDVIILKNGLNLEKFRYNSMTKSKVINELDIQGEFIIGHIGRFNYQKNHKFLLKVFKEVCLRNNNAVLLLIGIGELEEEMKEYSRKLGIDDKVKFLGIRKDIPELLMAMDVMVFPSFFEGMPNVIIEAQATGLTCIISDKITKEVKLTDNLEFKPLDNIKPWVESIEKSKDKVIDRKRCGEKVKLAGYDIKIVVADFVKTVFK